MHIDTATLIRKQLRTAFRLVGNNHFSVEGNDLEQRFPGSWSAMVRAYHMGVRDILQGIVRQKFDYQISGDKFIGEDDFREALHKEGLI